MAHSELGPLARFLTDDHARIEALLRRAEAEPDKVGRDVYDAFRAGLLKHIDMEEKILLPAIQHRRCGEPLPVAARLRLDHGALASLLMLPPRPRVVSAIKTILAAHNKLEEGPDGLYAICETLLGTEVDDILDQLHTTSEVSAAPPSDSPGVLEAVHRVVARAGYDFNDDESTPGHQEGKLNT